MNDPSSVAAACFVDTNIWLYAFIDGSDPRKRAAAQDVIRSESHVVVSTQVINEVVVNLLKKTAIVEGDVRKLVASFYRRYQVVELDQAILLLASRLREIHSFSFWDSLIAASALASGAAILYSEDMQDGLLLNGQMTIRNPLQKP